MHIPKIFPYFSPASFPLTGFFSWFFLVFPCPTLEEDLGAAAPVLGAAAVAGVAGAAGAAGAAGEVLDAACSAHPQCADLKRMPQLLSTFFNFPRHLWTFLDIPCFLAGTFAAVMHLLLHYTTM